jgi:hypothetical protein
VNAQRARTLLADLDLSTLFIEELGWDRYNGDLSVAVNGEAFQLQAIAEKRGMVAFLSRSDSGGFPDRVVRRKMEQQVARSVHEHLIVFADGEQKTQVWQWVRREAGRPVVAREHLYQAGQSGEALIQKLDALAFSLEEEPTISLVDVTTRARAAFDVDRITKRFYARFKTEHDAFLGFISGLESQEDVEWYTSVTLNRLMFIYFIQKKGFLDGDRDYLRIRLRRMQQQAGPDQFHSFYRHFLLRLFHEGLGKRERSSELDNLLGTVPYLNGGLFDVHELERAHPNISIPDEAFERLFDFFDSYQWHLDDRPLRADNEVNPDVLGYIFEQYINQKQMGAYYTKEDITHYIAAYTIIPCLLQRIEARAADLGESTDFYWQAIIDSPERYLPVALTHGVTLELPTDIAAKAHDPLDATLNTPAPAPFGHPYETWREVIRRRRRAQVLLDELHSGAVRTPDDLVGRNLDIRQWAQDVVEACDSPRLLRAVYEALEELTVIDPTCGSGAFLFAALNILEPLYEAALERMEGLLAEPMTAPDIAHWLRLTLDEVEQHPNKRFFILKKITVNNLYGVDVMEEAVEICKLRLFLKLVSQVDRAEEVEPLPDIDFNIRAGNTVVGFVNMDDVERAVLGGEQVRIDVTDAMAGIRASAVAAETAFDTFHELQLTDGAEAGRTAAKDALSQTLAVLRLELDRYLAAEYGVDLGDDDAFTTWRESHQPFHWLTEFYGLMRDGGFDAIVGNPPYLEVSKLDPRYRPLNFETEGSRDIYAWIVERTFDLLATTGRVGMIVPISISSSGSFEPLRSVVLSGRRSLWLSHYANRPAQLFSGAQNRLTILLYGPSSQGRISSTRYHRWDAKEGERETLFDLLQYQELNENASGAFHGLLAKVGTVEALSILDKLASSRTAASSTVPTSGYPVYWVRVPGYFCQFFLEPPMARPEAGGAARPRGELNKIFLPDERTQRILHAVLNSSTYYQFYVAYSDGRHINPSDVQEFPFDLERLDGTIADQLVDLSRQLEREAARFTSHWRKSGLLIDSLDSRPLKPLIDQIDAVLAAHYGFSESELEYIVNYDFKFRVGALEADPASVSA